MFEFDNDKKLYHYNRLQWAHQFQLFLANKFNTLKRFGLEGVEGLIPGLK